MTTEPQPTPTPAAALSPQPELAPGNPGQGPTLPPQSSSPPAAAPLPQHKIRRTRISGLWVSVGFFAVVLLLLLIFILQNSKTVEVSYLGLHGHLSLGVALLLAAVCGVLLVVLAGAARISQLRAVARPHRRARAGRPASAGCGRGPAGTGGPMRSAPRGPRPRGDRPAPPASAVDERRYPPHG